ncbi:polysaccharide biosynthesis/export family protein [Spirosoma rigui]|uniref:polysaccharide biosynthesis/export family protein n=1 Tax=Spirosoma rigui TaxID=564064 RepID=UPI001FE9ADE7|nr:SLBB domain-containing protein [Spirosoma rigui]
MSPVLYKVRIGMAALCLAITGLTAHAQVAPSSGAGTTTSPAAPRGGAVQPGQGSALPGGINPSSLPPSVQRQIQQQTGQTPGRNVQTGRSNAQPTNNGVGAPNATVQDNSGVNRDRASQEAVSPNDSTYQPQTNQEQIENGYEAARIRERNEIRRKIFGSTLFNDPAATNPFQPNISMATPRNYIVGPGDQLNIRLYGFSESDFSQTVSPEGAVYFAQATGIGPVVVSGLSVEQAKERITNRLASKYVGLRKSQYGPQNTFLEVSLSGIRSIRVTVTGDAIRPGTYTLSSLSTVMNAVYQAGGPNELGSFRKVQLIRNNKVIATLDLYDYLLNGTQRNDFRLQDNDNIRFTTFLERVEITGTVKRNNIFEMLPGETLDRLLFYAGDFASNAYKGRVKVTRLTDRERKVIDVTTAEFKTFVMQDGDQVTVEQLLDRFENQITIEGAVFRPGQYSLDQNKTLRQLLKSAEGLKGDAFTGRINIVRTREDLAIENITVNLANILAGTEADITLQREDQIIIPSRFDLAEAAQVSVQGEVNQPNSDLPYMANMTLNDALLRAGGLRESAAASQVEVVRRKKDVDPRSASSQVAEIIRFNVNRDLSINADENKFVLEPFDQIIVRRSPNYAVQTYANIEGEVILPGSYAIRSKDQKVSDLIGLAGGLTPQAYVEGATLIRRVILSPDEIARQQRSISELANDVTRSTVEVEAISPDKPESIGINLKKIIASPGSSEDILLQEGDILRIPKLLETVRIQGEVLLPTTVKYRSGQTFQDYISQSGGFTNKSQRKKSFVVYANGSVDRTRKFMFFNIYPRVEPGSEVVVPRQTTNPLTPQQILGQATAITSSIMTLILGVLAFRSIR